MGYLIAKWADPAGHWTGMLTHELYGLHFSVCGYDESPGVMARLPTDAECEAAKLAFRYGRWEESAMEEVTGALAALGWKVNPHVRQFVPRAEAQRLYARAAEKLS